MDLIQISGIILRFILIPILAIGSRYLIAFVKVKMDEIISKSKDSMMQSYLTMLQQAVMDCVAATNQTYVESLKDQNLFDAEAQKQAFEKTFNAVMNILSEDAKQYLTENLGDLDLYVNNLIESSVSAAKIQ